VRARHLLGFGLPGESYAPDRWFSVENYELGTSAMAELLLSRGLG
jgi:hypothetical protein